MNKFIKHNSNNHKEPEKTIAPKPGIFEIFIRRPVLTIVLNIIITVIGFVTWQNLNVRELPKLSFPAIRVTTEYPGAGPSVIESQITIPLEESFAGLPGLDYIESSTSNGESKISLHFNNKQNIDAAAAEVRDRVMKAKHSFPPSLRDPTISKSSNDERELIRLVAFGDKYNLSEIGDQIQRYAKGQIESTLGVASVRVFGVSGGGDSGAFQIHALISPEKLHAYDLSIKEVRESIYQNSFKQPLGEIIQNDIAFAITINQKATGIEDYKSMIIKQRNYGAVRLQDVADIKIITSDPDSIVRYNGQPCVMMGVIAQQGANPMDISKSIRKKLNAIKKSLPKNLKLDIATDRSEIIDQSIKSVYRAIFEATIFVFLIILLFLRSWKSTFIPMITIPICLFGGFFIIYMFDFTINLLTLLAMVLAIGLVVDDAIVVLENIYRHIENKMSPFKAAIKGIKEIQFAIIAMTLTLMAVYGPIVLASGIIGKLFIEFAVTLAGTVLISGIVALTLTPMLCAKLLKIENEAEEKMWQTKARVFLDNVDKKYASWLTYALDNTKIIIIASLSLTFLAFLCSKYYLNSTLMPETDANLIRLDFNTPSGSTAKYTDTYVSKIEKIVKKTPYLANYIVSIQSGSSDDAIMIKLINLNKRKKSAKKILAQIMKDIDLVQSGIRVNGSCPSGILGGESEEGNLVTFVIQSQKPYDEMELIANEIHNKAIMKHKNIDKNSIKISRITPEKSFDINIDRSKAEQFNVRMAEIGDMLSFIMRGQPPADRFESDGKRYPMRLMVSEEFKKDPNNIKKLHIRSVKSQSRESGPQLIALHDLLEINETTERPLALRYEGMRSYEFLFNIKKGTTTKVYKDITKIMDKILPNGYKYAPTRELRKTLNEGSNITSIFILAFLFIFLIMAAQFESFIDPLIIMLSVPMALAGGILILIFIPNGSLNIFTYIALITLIGLITKHGILIVDFANKSLKHKKVNREMIRKAVQEAAILRLRPILMTTFAMVLGALPLALSSGSGYEIRSQIGWVIVSGLLVGTLFTIFLLPCVYISIKTYVAQFKKYPKFED